MSHPARGAWIETPIAESILKEETSSHPARGAWIETIFSLGSHRQQLVAPRPGCVD